MLIQCIREAGEKVLEAVGDVLRAVEQCPAVHGIEQHRARILSALDLLCSSLDVVERVDRSRLDFPVSGLGLSARARKGVRRRGIETLGDLVQRTSDELLEIKGFGLTSLQEVREKLRYHGMTLRGEP